MMIKFIRRNMSNKFLLLFLLLCICTPVLAQQKIVPQVEFDRVKAKR